nr:MAG TPA: hypothetical protein [Herelleviridae sp.]
MLHKRSTDTEPEKMINLFIGAACSALANPFKR